MSAPALSHFISEKLERPFFLKGKPGCYPELRGKYRPFAVRDQLSWNNRASKIPSDDMADYEAGTIAERLVSWSIATEQPTVATILRLDGELFIRLRDVICYGALSDIDPESRSLPKSDAEVEEALKKS